MEIKENTKHTPFQTTAKEYVINMMKGSAKGGKRTLHHKNTACCKDSQGISLYVDFDSYEEATTCGIPVHPCGRCFPEKN